MARRSAARSMLLGSLAASAVGLGVAARRRRRERVATETAQAATPIPPRAEWWDAPQGLFGYHWPAEQPRATLLLQHGFGEHAGRYVEHYAGFVPALNAAGIDVFAFDMAGHGRSPGRRGVTDVGAMAEAHRAARRELAARGRPLLLFGHSLGGLVTALSVAREGAGIAAVALSSPALPDAAPLPLRMVARLLKRVAPGVGVASLGDASGTSRIPAEVAAYVADPLVFQKRIPAELGVTALDAGSEVFAGAGRWSVPTLLLHGTADRYTDPRGSQALHDAIAAPDKKLTLVADARHELLNDLPRKVVLREILAWLEARI